MGGAIGYVGAVISVTVAFVVARTVGGQALTAVRHPWVVRMLAHVDERPLLTVIALRAILAQAMALGGSTLRDFRDAHGMSGEFQAAARVYDREGQACAVCSTPIRRVVQGQRSSYFCAHCQRR